jgi:hypothetical protein
MISGATGAIALLIVPLVKGSTPAMMENAIASGIKAKATTIPASIFLPGWLSLVYILRSLLLSSLLL